MISVLCLDMNPALKLMSRRVLGRRINTSAEEVLQSVTAMLRAQHHVCTTADIWSTKHRTFMGVSAHWVMLLTPE